MGDVYYTKSPRLRLRPYEPWHAAVAYTPDKPALHWPNATSWLVLELCEGVTSAQISEAVADALPGRAGGPPGPPRRRPASSPR